MPLERVSQGFKDISMSFQSNPLNNDLIAIKNVNAITRSIRNIVLTTPGEKFFDPDFGSNVSRLLFENVDDITASQIQEEIEFSISNYEPRVKLIDVQVIADNDNASFDTIITYEVIGADVPPQALEFALQSTR
jgi:phage baseplate assembly protein W|tara:strand:+ start:390 stop:791 length:402 start_codon:yes stop_codon:yes gene_type:complete